MNIRKKSWDSTFYIIATSGKTGRKDGSSFKRNFKQHIYGFTKPIINLFETGQTSTPFDIFSVVHRTLTQPTSKSFINYSKNIASLKFNSKLMLLLLLVNS